MRRDILLPRTRTGDATPARIVVCRLLPSETARVSLTVVARAGNGDSAAWDLQGVVKSDAAGTLSIIGSPPSPLLLGRDLAAATWGVALDVSGKDVGVLATGAAATSIDWRAHAVVVGF